MATKFKITAEDIFQINASSFAISPSGDTYYIARSVTGEEGTFITDEEAVDDNKILTVIDVPGMFYKLVGNTEELNITY